MKPMTPTFVFDEDGKVYAYVDGKIVASADDADELEVQLSKSVQAADVPPQFQKQDPEEDDEEKSEEPEEKEASTSVENATHVQTPNGLKGTILGKQKGLWGDQITIRLENGRIAKFDVTPESKVEYIVEKKVADTPYQSLLARLDEMPDGTKSSLVARIKELKAIKNEASALVREAAYVDQDTLDNIVVQADYEMREVTDALAAIEDAEAYAPPAPFSTGVVEQESMGGNDSSWLDGVAQEMIAENEAQDFDQFMDEGPEAFVAELDTPILEDAAEVNDRAADFVSSHTAGMESSVTSEFTKAWMERIAQVRVTELEAREEKQRIAKEAASEEDHDGPAEGLFF